jgi:DNA-binding IclR family transcriptional regulator
MRPQSRRAKGASPTRVGARAAASDRHFVTALARGLTVLACFRASDSMLSNGEIAARCGLPKSTVSRLTYTLTRMGYLQYVEDRAMYRLGSAALAVGTAMLSRMNIRQVARPMMQEVADFAQAVVALGVRVNLGIIYVEVSRSPAAVTLALDVGSRVPIATTAIGRAYLASITDEERVQILRGIRESEGSGWPRTRAQLASALVEYRRLGCCTSFGEWQPDINGIGIGVRTGRALPPMAINCGGAAFKLTPAFLLDKVRPRLIDLVRNLESSLGHE